MTSVFTFNNLIILKYFKGFSIIRLDGQGVDPMFNTIIGRKAVEINFVILVQLKFRMTKILVNSNAGQVLYAIV